MVFPLQTVSVPVMLTIGGLGTAFIVTVAAAGVEQVLSAMLRTLKVYVFGLNPLNVVVG